MNDPLDLWTIKREKSWNHVFEMLATLIKRGYPINADGKMCTCLHDVNNLSLASPSSIFPSNKLLQGFSKFYPVYQEEARGNLYRHSI